MKNAIASSPAATQRLPLWLRLLFALALLFLAGFAAFGFLATFEPNPGWVVWSWRAGYAVLGFGALAGAVKLLSKRGRQAR